MRLIQQLKDKNKIGLQFKVQLYTIYWALLKQLDIQQLKTEVWEISTSQIETKINSGSQTNTR